MTPRSFDWTKVPIGKWQIYYVGEDTLCFTKEAAGIVISFNDTIPYRKARQIADEIIENIKSIGQNSTIIVILKPTIYLKQGE